MRQKRDSSVGNRLGLPKVSSVFLVFMWIYVYYLTMLFQVIFQIIIEIYSYRKKELIRKNWYCVSTNLIKKQGWELTFLLCFFIIKWYYYKCYYFIMWGKRDRLVGNILSISKVFSEWLLSQI